MTTRQPSQPSEPSKPNQPSTSALRAEHKEILASLKAVAERVETLHEQTTPQQMLVAREVLEFVRKQIAPTPEGRSTRFIPRPTGRRVKARG